MEEFLRVQRGMAWERAKGELQAMLLTIRRDVKGNRSFIKDVEDSGLEE